MNPTGARGHLACVLGVMILSGCGSDSGGDPPPDDPPAGDPTADDLPGLALIGFDGEGPGELTSPWLLDTTFFRVESNTPGSGDGNVDLLNYDDTFPVSDYVEFYTPALDTCELRRQNVAGGGSGGVDNSPPLISGGAQLFVDSGNQPFFTFAAERDGEDVVYRTNDGLPGPLPDDATLTIPGDAFPALVDYPLPNEPPVPVRLLPEAEEPITVASEYAWIPGGANDAVELEFRAYDASGKFIDFAIICVAIDDGSFVLPADALAEVDAIQDELRLRYTRERQQIELRDDITIRSRVIVAE